MSDAWLFVAELLFNVLALSWLALAMDLHWRQALGPQQRAARTAMVLRALGISALVLSLSLCLRADHASMASLVWIMSLAAAALTVAFLLAWRPHWLAPLILRKGSTKVSMKVAP